MTIKKWQLVAGRVYRLLGTYTNKHEAIKKAQQMRKENFVHLTINNDGTIAVYWRPKMDTQQCDIHKYKVM